MNHRDASPPASRLERLDRTDRSPKSPKSVRRPNPQCLKVYSGVISGQELRKSELETMCIECLSTMYGVMSNQ